VFEEVEEENLDEFKGYGYISLLQSPFPPSLKAGFLF